MSWVNTDGMYKPYTVSKSVTSPVNMFTICDIRVFTCVQFAQQLCGSQECSNLFVLYVFLTCVFLFQINKLGNVESILYCQNSFVGTLDRKIFLHEKIKHENSVT